MLHANAIFPVSDNVTKTRDHTTVHAYSDEQVKMNSFVRVIFHTQPNKLTCWRCRLQRRVRAAITSYAGTLRLKSCVKALTGLMSEEWPRPLLLVIERCVCVRGRDGELFARMRHVYSSVLLYVRLCTLSIDGSENANRCQCIWQNCTKDELATKAQASAQADDKKVGSK